jgi:hypothetical protein
MEEMMIEEHAKQDPPCTFLTRFFEGTPLAERSEA